MANYMANLRPGGTLKISTHLKPEVSSWLPSLGLVPTTSLKRFTIQGPALFFGGLRTLFL